MSDPVEIGNFPLQGLVREIQVSGLTINRRLGLAWRKASTLSPTAMRFAERLLQHG